MTYFARLGEQVAGSAIFGDSKGVAAAMKRLRASINERVK